MIKTTFQSNLWQNDSLCEVIFQRKKNKTKNALLAILMIYLKFKITL